MYSIAIYCYETRRAVKQFFMLACMYYFLGK
jgi:hypothetical protein